MPSHFLRRAFSLHADLHRALRQTDPVDEKTMWDDLRALRCVRNDTPLMPPAEIRLKWNNAMLDLCEGLAPYAYLVRRRQQQQQQQQQQHLRREREREDPVWEEKKLPPEEPGVFQTRHADTPTPQEAAARDEFKSVVSIMRMILPLSQPSGASTTANQPNEENPSSLDPATTSIHQDIQQAMLSLGINPEPPNT